MTALPHTNTTKEYSWCAYTDRVRRMCDLLTSMGHTVFLYAGHENEARVAEHVKVVSPELWRMWYGSEDWDRNTFPDWNVSSPPWAYLNTMTIAKIRERLEPGDVILITSGTSHEPIARAFPQNISVEPFVGYKGVFTNHRVFESYAWMHHIYGRESREWGLWTDAVIPPHFDAELFSPLPIGPTEPRGDYLLFMARRITSKGIAIAGEVSQRTGIPLVVAGQEYETATPRGLGDSLVSYIGLVRGDDRIDLLRNAAALMSTTFYIEPGSNVSVEAQLCGTPVIATDWGVYTENINHGVSGYRVRNMTEAVVAANRCRAGVLNRADVRKWATSRYSAEAVIPLWDRYFERLGRNWYEMYNPRFFDASL